MLLAVEVAARVVAFDDSGERQHRLRAGGWRIQGLSPRGRGRSRLVMCVFGLDEPHARPSPSLSSCAAQQGLQDLGSVSA